MKHIAVATVALSATTAFASVLAPRATSLPPVTVKGNAFFAGNQRFYIRGVDYQPGGSSDAADPLSDIKICSRDIKEWAILREDLVRKLANSRKTGSKS
jgi:hypothetical protein